MVETKRHFQRPRRFILALLIFIVGCSGDPSGAPSFFSLGTAGTGGIYYPLGGVIASLLTQADENQIFNAEVTGGAVENINRIRAGQMELAFATANTVYDAYFGSPEFNGTVPDLRVVAPLYPNPTHILVAEGSEAQSIEDFRGLRVSVGAPGSGTEQISKRILEAHAHSNSTMGPPPTLRSPRTRPSYRPCSPTTSTTKSRTRTTSRRTSQFQPQPSSGSRTLTAPSCNKRQGNDWISMEYQQRLQWEIK